MYRHSQTDPARLTGLAAVRARSGLVGSVFPGAVRLPPGHSRAAHSTKPCATVSPCLCRRPSRGSGFEHPSSATPLLHGVPVRMRRTHEEREGGTVCRHPVCDGATPWCGWCGCQFAERPDALDLCAYVGNQSTYCLATVGNHTGKERERERERENNVTTTPTRAVPMRSCTDRVGCWMESQTVRCC